MKKYLLFTVFASGMTTLAAELSASRLIGRSFGDSNLVWASIIGLILIYLAAGYSYGGKWADRDPSPRALYRILAWGAFTLGLTPYLASPTLKYAASAFEILNVGIMAGSFLLVLIFFSAPITLLGMVSPFAIRLAVNDAARAGEVSGQIYSISTIGSFIGTFLPALVAIPTIGVNLTFFSFGFFLLVVALVGLAKFVDKRETLRLLWMPALLILAALLSAGQRLKNNKGQVYETESAYNYIQVQEQNGYTLLRLNDGQGVHSIYHPNTLEYGGPWEQFSVAPFFYPNRKVSDVKSMAIVGLAAGTAARQASAIYGNILIDGFELDGKIVEVGKKYFGLNLPNLNVVLGDGRLNLSRSKNRYDVVAIDAYRPPYIPAHMTTREFFEIAAAHLNPDGALVINVGSVPGDRRLINGLATTIQTQFASVHVMDLPGTLNTMVFATRQPTYREDFAANLVALSQDPAVAPLLIHTMALTYANLQNGYEQTIVFTDDLAPIEWIVNDMTVRFVLQGGLKYLQ